MKLAFSVRSVAIAAAVTALSTFSAAGLHAQEAAKPVAKATPVAKAVASSKVRPLSVTVALIGTQEIAGTLTDTSALEMRTSFGTASIPLSEVAGVRFASADNASTTVVMLNGDSITGATDVKLVTVETEWGTASINGNNIGSILFVPGLAWNPSTGLNGKRWTLATQKAAPKPVAAKTAPAATSSTASRTPATSSRTMSTTRPSTTYRGR